MKYEWDPEKAVSNFGKHGISFEQATAVFEDPFAIEAFDDPHSTAEEYRYERIGVADGGVIVVIYTVRGVTGSGEVIRIVSARVAIKVEETEYLEQRYGK